MDLNRIVYIFAVAARHHSHDGKLAVVTLTQHIRITLAQTINRECEAAQLIARKRVGSGKIKDDFRLVCKNSWSVMRERFEIAGIVRTVRQLDI